MALCWKFCQETQNCKWMSFSLADKNCVAYQHCREIMEMNDYITSQVECTYPDRVHANCPPEICPLPKALFQKLFSKCPPNLTALPKNCPHPKTLFQKPSSKCPLCQMPSAIYSLPFALLQMPSTKRGNWQRAFDRGQSAEGKWQGVFDRGQLAEGKWQRAIGWGQMAESNWQRAKWQRAIGRGHLTEGNWQRANGRG